MATQVRILAGHQGCPVPPPHPTTASAPQEEHLQTVSLTGEPLFFFNVYMALFCTGIFKCKAKMDMIIKITIKAIFKTYLKAALYYDWITSSYLHYIVIHQGDVKAVYLTLQMPKSIILAILRYCCSEILFLFGFSGSPGLL